MTLGCLVIKLLDQLNQVAKLLHCTKTPVTSFFFHPGQGTATRKIGTRHDASINENNNIWGVFFRHK